MQSIAWALASIGLPVVLIILMVVSETDASLGLMVGLVYGVIFGMAIALLLLARGHAPGAGMQIIFSAVAGALGGLLVAGFALALFSIHLYGQTSVLFNVFAGAIGAATAAMSRFHALDDEGKSKS